MAREPILLRVFNFENGRAALETTPDALRDDESLVHAIYLTFFSRPPFVAEKTRALEYLQQASDRRTASEDLAWSMLCSIEFIFRH